MNSIRQINTISLLMLLMGARSFAVELENRVRFLYDKDASYYQILVVTVNERVSKALYFDHGASSIHMDGDSLLIVDHSNYRWDRALLLKIQSDMEVKVWDISALFHAFTPEGLGKVSINLSINKKRSLVIYTIGYSSPGHDGKKTVKTDQIPISKILSSLTDEIPSATIKLSEITDGHRLLRSEFKTDQEKSSKHH